MKYAFGFVFGVIVGGAVALMFAPTSGEELRTNIKSQVDVQSERLQEEFKVRMQQMQARMDQLSSQMQGLAEGDKQPDQAA